MKLKVINIEENKTKDIDTQYTLEVDNNTDVINNKQLNQTTKEKPCITLLQMLRLLLECFIIISKRYIIII